MNADVRELLSDSHRAVRAGDLAAGVRRLIEAGDCAARYQLWRSAARAYVAALELDLVDRTALGRLVGLIGRGGHAFEWSDYARRVERASWPHFGCRDAQLVIGDEGASVVCRSIGAVLSVTMPECELLAVHPDRRFAGMPLAMALIVLRCALWAPSGTPATPPRKARVAFAGGDPVELDELGSWRAMTAR